MRSRDEMTWQLWERSILFIIYSYVFYPNVEFCGIYNSLQDFFTSTHFCLAAELFTSKSLSSKSLGVKNHHDSKVSSYPLHTAEVLDWVLDCECGKLEHSSLVWLWSGFRCRLFGKVVRTVCVLWPRQTHTLALVCVWVVRFGWAKDVISNRTN